MRKILIALLALAASPMALAQTISTCTTSQTINLQNQKYAPVYAITLTAGETCNLNFQLPSDPTVAQPLTLKIIQSSSSPYSGAISGGTWPNGLPNVPQTAGAIVFAKCDVDTMGAFCFPVAPVVSPQVTLLSSGSGTYTTPAGTIFLTVEMLGGGGGGAGTGAPIANGSGSGLPVGPWSSSTSYSVNSTVSYGGLYYISCTANTNEEPDLASIYWTAGFSVGGDGANGANSIFGSLTASGGSAGTFSANTAGSGGSASGGDVDAPGNAGTIQATQTLGGWTFIPGVGGASNLGANGPGSGGAGGSWGYASQNCPVGASQSAGWQLIATQGGNGGGAGGYLRKTIPSPAPSYTYAVGSGGAGGAAGLGGNAGQAGSNGIVIVTAYQ
jgi:hypothetical protein